MRWETVACVVVAVAGLALECVAARLAHDTLGALPSVVLAGALMVVNSFALALFFARRRAASVALFLTASIVTVCHQGLLLSRYVRLQQEAADIVGFLYKRKVETGAFPEDLGGYSFVDRGLEKYFPEYRTTDEFGGFYLAFYVGNEGASHSYCPRDGWRYYPD